MSKQKGLIVINYYQAFFMDFTSLILLLYYDLKSINNSIECWVSLCNKRSL